MSLFSSVNGSLRDRLFRKQYQPLFPLKYDSVYGPYKPLTSLQESLHQNFVNLLLTSPGEWPMNPDLGVGLRHYLFEMSNSPKLQELRPKITRQLNKYLPRVKLHSIRAKSNDLDVDNNTLSIEIAYLILDNQLNVLTVLLDVHSKIIIEVSNREKFRDDIGSLSRPVGSTLDSNLSSNVTVL